MKQPLSYIHPNAKIAKNVVIEPFTSIDGDVEIGEGTWIGSNVSIMDGARIGKNCNIYPGAVISANPQDLKYNNEKTFVEIGDNVTIRNNCIFSNNTTLAGHVTVGDYVIISGLTAIHQFCSIGNHAFVTGGSLVRKDVPPYVKAAREPLSYVGINSVGLRRRGYESDKIREIQNIYRLLYQKNYNNSQACAIIEAEMEASDERDEILMFIKNSHRGIMKGYTKSN